MAVTDVFIAVLSDLLVKSRVEVALHGEQLTLVYLVYLWWSSELTPQSQVECVRVCNL